MEISFTFSFFFASCSFLSLCVLVLFPQFLIRFTRPYFINSLFLIAYFHCDYFSLICKISLESFYFWQALTVIHIYVLCIFHKEKLCVFFLAMKEKELYAYEIRSVRLHASLVTEHPMRTRRMVVWMGKCFFYRCCCLHWHMPSLYVVFHTGHFTYKQCCAHNALRIAWCNVIIRTHTHTHANLNSMERQIFANSPRFSTLTWQIGGKGMVFRC